MPILNLNVIWYAKYEVYSAPWATQIHTVCSFTIEQKINNVRLWKLSYYIYMSTRCLSGQGEICDIFSVNNHSFLMLVTYLMHVDVVDDTSYGC